MTAVAETSWVALFRGINVGGHNKLPMKELRAELEALGLKGVATYIQSGNVVFRGGTTSAAELAARIARTVQERHGFEAEVLVLTADELRAAVRGTPFNVPEDEAKTLHLFFLAAEPSDPDSEGLDAARAEGERWALRGKVFYLHTPAGYGRSKLAAKAERALGVRATARNWRSVLRILELAEQLDSP
jgi:uncharacterized protein (DUF1697 family)